jgi:4-amino-4-deoxy-L-arabinose transferase-like glycosyltransferase
LTPFIVSIPLGLAVYLLGKRIYKPEAAFIAAIIATTVPSIAPYAVLFYVDALFTLFFFLFVMSLIMAMMKNEKRYWILTAAFGAATFLTKLPGVLVLPILFVFFLYQLYREKNIKILKNYLMVLLLMTLFTGGYFIRNLVYFNTLSCDIGGRLEKNIPFLTNKYCTIKNETESKYQYSGRTEQTGTEAGVFAIGIMNYLDFAYGNVWFVVLGFAAGLVLILVRREHADVLVLLSIMWLFPMIVYLSGRAEDTSRYTLGWVPLIGLVAGSYFAAIYNFVKAPNVVWAGTILLLIINILVITFYLPTTLIIKILLGVSVNLLSLLFLIKKEYKIAVVIALFSIIIIFTISGMYTKLLSLKQVKAFSPTFFQACDWVKANTPKDSIIFTAWPYHTLYNCERRVGGGGPDVVLSGDLNLSLSELKADGVTHIFIQKWAISTQDLSERYPVKFVDFLNNNPDHFKKVYENGEPDISKCATSGCDGAIVYQIVY